MDRCFLKVEKKILIEEQDISGLHQELEDVFDFLADHAVDGDPKIFFGKEFPVLSRLKSLLDGSVISEPKQRVYDRLSDKEETTVLPAKVSRLKLLRAPVDFLAGKP